MTGQVDRWIPELIVENLIQNNKDIHISVFIHLQFSNNHHKTSFNVELGIPANYTILSLQKSLSELSQIYSTHHSELVDFQFQQPYSHSEWQRLMNRPGKLLDRISEYTDRQHIILNLYKNQVSCIDSILQYENQTNTPFDYIINAREDLYFFLPINLHYALNQLDSKQNCGLITKGCIMNYGVNMRLQIARRNDGIKIFRSRLEFYRSMFAMNKQIKNPESFELFQLQSYGLDSCTLPVDLFPVASARIVNISNHKNEFCLLEKEVQSLWCCDHPTSIYSCVPSVAISQVEAIKCSDYQIKPPPPPTTNLQSYLLGPSSLRKSITLSTTD
jgi:hypothetical protein